MVMIDMTRIEHELATRELVVMTKADAQRLREARQEDKLTQGVKLAQEQIRFAAVMWQSGFKTDARRRLRAVSEFAIGQDNSALVRWIWMLRVYCAAVTPDLIELDELGELGRPLRHNPYVLPFDVTTIPGYADMTDEEKRAAFQAEMMRRMYATIPTERFDFILNQDAPVTLERVELEDTYGSGAEPLVIEHRPDGSLTTRRHPTEEEHHSCLDCNGAPGEPAPCPFDLELHGDDTPCRCCDDCRDECRRDV